MATTSLIRRSLLKALRTKIIPRAKADGVHNFLLAQPPFIVPPGVTVAPHPGTPLRETGEGRAHFYINRWDEQWLHAVRLPLLCFIFEGEADWRVGVTESMADRLRETDPNHPDAACDYHVLSLPEGTFFLMPPGVPYPRATVHWERPHPERARSRIFWLQVFPAGAFCHICSTENMVHMSDPSLFVRDTRLSHIVDFIIEEMQGRGPHFEQVVHSQLIALLLRVERAMATNSILLRSEPVTLGPAEEKDSIVLSHLTAVRRACSYIEANLHEPLSLATIASHAYLSASHLNRVFRAEKGISVMKFVMQRRLETARALLTDSDLPIQEIGRMVGFPHPSHFTQAFSQHIKMSPAEYRKRYRP